MKTGHKLLILFVITIFFCITGLFILREYKISKYNFTDYYRDVARGCGLFSSIFPYNCCFESVQEMAKFGYKSAKDCPDGYAVISSMCIGSIGFCAPIPKPITDIDECFKIKNEADWFSPKVRSNIPIPDSQVVNQETEKIDACIFQFVDKHEETLDKYPEICEKIKSNYYRYLCRQRIAFHLNNPDLCTVEFLGEESNVVGCFYTLSIKLKDISLCDRAPSTIDCRSNYDERSQ